MWKCANAIDPKSFFTAIGETPTGVIQIVLTQMSKATAWVLENTNSIIVTGKLGTQRHANNKRHQHPTETPYFP
jgi:hypothetical protein